MTATGAARVWQRMDRLERATCLRINRGCRGSAVHAVFVAASRLGDGIAWYALIGALALCATLRMTPSSSMTKAISLASETNASASSLAHPDRGPRSAGTGARWVTIGFL